MDEGRQVVRELREIAETNPYLLEPFKKLFLEAGNDVTSLHGMQRWIGNKLGVLKKAIIDGEPEVPSLVVQGLNGVRYNHMLSGLAPLRAITGNSMLTAIKPASVFIGAKLTGDDAVLKRALYTYGGIAENFKRGFKVLKNEWRLANAHPEEAMLRGRADLRNAKMDKLQYMDSIAEIWKKDGELGKLAM